MNRKGLDEKGMTKNEAVPLWIWIVIRNDFITKTLRKFTTGTCRFKVHFYFRQIPLLPPVWAGINKGHEFLRTRTEIHAY